MHFQKSTFLPGATPCDGPGMMAPVGQAFTQSSHSPQRSSVNGLSKGSTASVTTLHQRTWGPSVGVTHSVCLPIQPRPAMVAAALACTKWVTAVR